MILSIYLNLFFGYSPIVLITLVNLLGYYMRPSVNSQAKNVDFGKHWRAAQNREGIFVFYDIYTDLCAQKGVSESKAAESVGLNRSAVAKWKKGAVPGGQTMQMLATYFDVPINLLLGHPPFDYWTEINQDRSNFLRCANADPKLLEWVWGIKTANPDEAPMKYFIDFLSEAIESARPLEDGGWSIVFRPQHAFINNFEFPATEEEESLLKRLASQSDNDIERIVEGVVNLNEREQSILFSFSIRLLGALEAKRKNLADKNPGQPHTDSPQGAPSPLEGKNTTPAADGAERPPEGE